MSSLLGDKSPKCQLFSNTETQSCFSLTCKHLELIGFLWIFSNHREAAEPGRFCILFNSVWTQFSQKQLMLLITHNAPLTEKLPDSWAVRPAESNSYKIIKQSVHYGNCRLWKRKKYYRAGGIGVIFWEKTQSFWC